MQVCGKDIRTTGEHPFYVEGMGWISAKELVVGDRLTSHDGQWIALEAVTDLKEVATVYNLSISDNHTYFVGSRKWGFSVWAHNQYEIVHVQGQWRIRNIHSGDYVTVQGGGRTYWALSEATATRYARRRGIEVAPSAAVRRWEADIAGFESTAAEMRLVGYEESAVQRWLAGAHQWAEGRLRRLLDGLPDTLPPYLAPWEHP